MTDEALQRGTPLGSLRHYALQYAPAHARATLQALYAYEAEIDDSVHAAHEVAHVRLAWWRGEVDRLLGGAPAHPVTRALLSLRAHVGDELALLHETLAAADISLARLVLQDEREREAWLFRAGGALQVLAAAACAGGRPLSERERAFARRLGAGVRRVASLRDLRGLLARGVQPFPLDALARAGVEPGAMQPTMSVTPALDKLIEEERTTLAQELASLPEALDRRERAAQRQGLVLASLHARLLPAIRHDGELARARVELPAFTRLWTAWRTAVRFRD